MTERLYKEPKFYRCGQNDYIMAYGNFRSHNGSGVYAIASAIKGNVYQLIHWELSPLHFKNRCRRINHEQVPEEWIRAFMAHWNTIPQYCDKTA